MLRNLLLLSLIIFLSSGSFALAQNAEQDNNNAEEQEEVDQAPQSFLDRILFWRNGGDSRERYRNPYEHYSQSELDMALWQAVTDRELGTMRDLLEEGASANTRNLQQRTVLIEAARIGYLDGVRLLIDYGASINSRDMYGGTAYIYASRGGHSDIVYLLQRNGARVN